MEKRFLVVVILLAVVGVLSGILYFQHPDDSERRDLLELPMEIAGWKGVDIELDEKTYEILETRNVVLRKYENAQDERVYLYIVASDINRKVAHPPEVCFIGEGIEIVEKDKVEFSVTGLEKPLLANSFVTRKNGSESMVFYWFKAGDRFTTNYLAQQAKVVVNQMMHKKCSAALIRVSTAIDNGNKEKASQTLHEFSRRLIPLIFE